MFHKLPMNIILNFDSETSLISILSMLCVSWFSFEMSAENNSGYDAADSHGPASIDSDYDEYLEIPDGVPPNSVAFMPDGKNDNEEGGEFKCTYFFVVELLMLQYFFFNYHSYKKIFICLFKLKIQNSRTSMRDQVNHFIVNINEVKPLDDEERYFEYVEVPKNFGFKF